MPTNTLSYERVSKEDGHVSLASEGQVRRGLETSVKDIELALSQIADGAEIGNNFFIYRRKRPAPSNVATEPKFIRGLIYRTHDGQPYPGVSAPHFKCYMPANTGNWQIADCWVCDEDGKIDPNFNASPVPVCAEALGAVIGKKGVTA